jgi:hypothetical protein
MRLCARKARHLDVGEVIAFGIISGPSGLGSAACGAQSVAAVVCLVDALTLLLFVCRKQCCSNCSTTTAHAEWHMRVSQNEPSVTISSSVMFPFQDWLRYNGAQRFVYVRRRVKMSKQPSFSRVGKTLSNKQRQKQKEPQLAPGGWEQYRRNEEIKRVKKDRNAHYRRGGR